MSVTIKVFFQKASGGQEIRRFTVSQQDPALFDSVKSKIRQLYPSLATADFQLTWKDSDGDDIVASCTEEMQEAIANVHDGVLRVYIAEPAAASATPTPPKPAPQPQPDQARPKEKPQQQQKPKQQQQQQQQQQNGGVFHPGVTCDGCEGPIYGTRFKSCVLDDYDLCSNCEATGLHAEHDMYKIETPRPNPMNFLPPHLGRYIQRYMQGYWNGASATSASGQGNANTGPGAGANASASSTSTSGAGATPDPKSREQYDEYLKNVGANIAAFLDPFGIDVSYEVHHGNGQSQQGNCHRGRGRCGNWQNMRRGKSTESQKEKMETDGAENQKEAASEERKEEAATSEDVPMEENSPRKETRDSSPSTEDWTFVPNDGTEILIPTQAPIPMPAPATPKPAPSPKETAAPAPPAPAATPTPASTPVPPTSEPTVAPTRPEAPPRPAAAPRTGSGNLYPSLRVQQSLDQMLSMGFTNTDGWLSDLLAEHDGDIGVTLDAIKAKATQQLENLRESR